MTPTREETLQAERDATADLRAELAAARQSADDWKTCAEKERAAALEEAAKVLDGQGNEASALQLYSVAARYRGSARLIRALKSKP